MSARIAVRQLLRSCRAANPSIVSRMASSIPPPPALQVPLEVPEKLLLGPGPSNVPSDVLHAMTHPMLGYLHKEFLDIMVDVREGIKYMFQTQNRNTFAVSGTGHAGMEASICNLVEPGDEVLILTHGLWGERAADIAERQGAKVHTLVRNPGEAFSFEDIENTLKTVKPSLMFIVQGESSTGVLHPIQGLGEMCHRYGTLLLVDTVASLGATPFYADEWGVDCVYSATQKALSCPPGLAPISFSDRAWQKVVSRKTKPRSFYLDMKMVANYWGCEDDAPRYHHTGMISLVYALRVGLSRVLAEGLENSIERHQKNALRLHKGLEEIGLELFVKDPKYRAPTLTTVLVPDGVDWKGVINHLMSNHKIEIAGGLGATAGKIWRIGLMGYNSSETNVDRALAAIKEALEAQK